ncbi:MAG TPA: glycosyltransferase family 2 protein [Anaerolineae bacterium]|nr:glycosyltransferase family 2 protein [Anaerolineae bacterium]
MTVSIVIVNWNACDVLLRCLRSIEAAAPDRSTDTMVIDNASQDNSVAQIRQQFKWVTLIENAENVGFAAANNQGIRASCGEFILLLNPDTELHSDSLQHLIQFMRDHPHCGAAGPRLLKPDGTLQPSAFPLPSLGREVWRLFQLDAIKPYALYSMSRWPIDTARSVESVQGACVIVRRAALDQIGLFDEDYFIYSEEIDLCHRLRKVGWSIDWVPQSKVMHYGGQSTRQVAAEMFKWLYQGKITFFRKHSGRPAAVAYKFILGAASLARLLMTPFAWLEPPSQRERHLALARNYWRLIRSLPSL